MSDTFARRVMERIASGEEEALSELYRRHAQMLYNYAARVLLSADEAADAVSGVFQSIWSGVPAWPDPAPPPGVVMAARMRESLLGKMRGAGKRPWREVDLWSIVSSRGADAPDVEASCAAIRKCGAVSTAVLAMVYFGGRTIDESAAGLSMTESECRSRLQVSLEALAGGNAGGRRPAPHGGKFQVDAAAWALGAVAPIEEPAYANHLADGCPECRAEIDRYSSAAHLLPSLLPEVRLPDDLHEKLLFSVRLAGVTASVKAGRERRGAEAAAEAEPAADRPDGARREGTEGPATVARSGGQSSGPWRRYALAGGVVAVAAIVLLGMYARTLSGRIEEQSGIVESLTDRYTELILKYDRLAGISGFFESRGVVTALNGTPEYPGLAGRIVWDTAARSAMLQVLNPPEELRHGLVRVSALEGDELVRVAEFRGDGGETDRGSVFYRFWALDPGPEIFAGGFSVDVLPETGGPEGEYRSILRSAVSGGQ